MYINFNILLWKFKEEIVKQELQPVTAPETICDPFGSHDLQAGKHWYKAKYAAYILPVVLKTLSGQFTILIMQDTLWPPQFIDFRRVECRVNFEPAT